MLGRPAPLSLTLAWSSRGQDVGVHLEQGEKDEVQNVQVQAGRPHSGRPSLLPRSRPVTTEREHQHLQSCTVDLLHGMFATVGV